MARRSPDVAKVIKEADQIEKRVARAWFKSVEKLKENIPVFELGVEIANKRLGKAMKLLTQADVEDSLEPVIAILRDAVKKGGALGVTQIKKAVRRANK